MSTTCPLHVEEMASHWSPVSLHRGPNILGDTSPSLL